MGGKGTQLTRRGAGCMKEAVAHSVLFCHHRRRALLPPALLYVASLTCRLSVSLHHHAPPLPPQYIAIQKATTASKQQSENTNKISLMKDPGVRANAIVSGII